ncbi:MAG: diaminopimelate decarboxylase, partial [Candidatus Omnitrophica bacterium]|nr:diaminopimelate decarboxylase [Candidatus Omnitrophota bacterium]
MKLIELENFFYYKNNLYCEGVKVREVAKKVGTPFYLYSKNSICSQYKKFEKAFSSLSPLICYSLKANSNLSILKILKNLGAGADIVSLGELFLALKAGIPPGRIVFAGVGKREEEIKEAIKKGIYLFNVESASELRLINEIASRLNKRVNCNLRVNPEVEPKTHRHVATGKRESKFGIGWKEVARIFKNKASFPKINILGLHIHLGSQITFPEVYQIAIKKLISFIRKEKIKVDVLDIGGGFPIQYEKKVSSIKDFAIAFIPLLKEIEAKIIFEPGRYIVGGSSILVTKVLYLKRSFVIVDAGLNDLLRPSLYGAYHEIVPLKKSSKGSFVGNIVGPICESSDFLGENRRLPLSLKEGDFLAIKSS